MNKNNILAIWIFKKDLPLKKITKKEYSFTKEMSNDATHQFIHSRGYARYALSQIFNINPLEIPLEAPPNKPPILPLNYGCLSLSHCKDMLVCAWCKKNIGIDIERADRRIECLSYFKRLFLDDLKSIKTNLSDNELLRSRILDLWVLRESLVKWEKSSIFRGLRDWELSKNCSYASNKESGIQVKVQNIYFNEWKIGVASNHYRNFYPLQVCF